MQPSPTISRSEFELVLVLYELEQTGNVSSLFDLAGLLLLEFSWAWRLSRRARDHGLVVIENGHGRGFPSHIGLTDLGRQMAQVAHHTDDTLIHIILNDRQLAASSILAAAELHRRLHKE